MTASSHILDRLINTRILSHITFWVAVVLVLAYHGSLFGGNLSDNLINMLALLPVQMIAAYALIYYQIPQWLSKQRYIIFFLSLIVLAYLLSALARWSVINIAEPLIGIESLEETIVEILTDPIYLIQVFTTSVYIPAALLFLLKMTKERFTQQNQLVTLEKEKRTTELDFLKAQMNPHFLFNTLNNIYSLSKNKAEQTPEMILKLSEILDYTIYECNEPTVPVMKEWALIESFVDLETLRYSDELSILLDEQVSDKQAHVAPLILISLVENAFKYSLKQEQGVPVIKVKLVEKAGQLSFEVYNSKATDLPESQEKKRGIGVQNVKRQLVLQYPDRHTLIIDDMLDAYQVSLTIKLN